MAAFGDYEPLDALDTEPADALQVAMKLHRLRRAQGLEGPTWELLADPERSVRVGIVVDLLGWLRRSGAAR